MPSESPSAVAAVPAAETPAWPVLTLHEKRVLGVLVEKAKTTPDVYPLSINALVTGCNQKSNRDPVLDLSDLEVEDVLAGLQKKGLAIKITGGRVIRWRHGLYEAWRVDKVELAVLAELLLRGPQTEGELRGRASRMEPIDDLDALRGVLKRLAERRLVVYLTPEGRRGSIATHGFHAPQELDRLRVQHKEEAERAESAPAHDAAAAGSVAPRPAPAALTALETRLNDTQAEMAALRATVADLQAKVAGLADQMSKLQQALGG
jgi:uncharacterized protein YceH (UPF0502 family)